MHEQLFRQGLGVYMPISPSWIYAGPKNEFNYTILQGFFTVLAIKEVVSVTRCFVKGASSSLRVRAAILWHMVENWDDLFKVARQLLLPRRMHSFKSDTYPVRAPLTVLGWRRLLISGLIALWLFGVDFALIVGSVSFKSPVYEPNTPRLRWSNTGNVPFMKHVDAKVISRSFSRELGFWSDNDKITFTQKPILSLNRSELTKKSLSLLSTGLPLMGCNLSEPWHIVCDVYFRKRLIRYDLSLHLGKLDQKPFFVATNNISVNSGRNNMDFYKVGLAKELGINASVAANKPNYFAFGTSMSASKYFTTWNGDQMLMHDAIACVFFDSIRITSTLDEELYLGEGAKGDYIPAQFSGKIAEFEHPLLPLSGTILIYIVFQIISIVQQSTFKLRSTSPELNALLEIAGGSCIENISNVAVNDMPVVCSVTAGTLGSDDAVGHIGYLPGRVVSKIKQYTSAFRSAEAQSKLGMVSKECLEKIEIMK